MSPELPIVPGRVSVITACLNDGQWLPETVASVKAQTHPDVEHIVIDDGSTDPHTIDVLDSLSAQGVTVLRLAHAGLPAARNAGIAQSTGEFFLPLDCDDLIHPEYSARAVAAFEKHPDAAIAVPDIRYFGDQDRIAIAEPLPVGAALRDSSMPSAMFVRRSAFDAVGGYDPAISYGEDAELWVRLMHRYPERVFLREVLFYYRMRPGQMTSQSDVREVPSRAQIFCKNYDIFATHADGFLGRVRAERAALDHFEARYGWLDRLLPRRS